MLLVLSSLTAESLTPGHNKMLTLVLFFHLKVIRSYFRRADPFYDEQENHSLIGVANVFLESLFYDVKLQYAVPIINQKGEVTVCFKWPVAQLVQSHIIA